MSIRARPGRRWGPDHRDRLGVRGPQARVRVVGVQSDGYQLAPGVRRGRRRLATPSTIAEGTTAPFDPLMYERLRQSIAEWIVVPEPELRRAVSRLAREAKVVAEGAGALAFAAMVAEAPRERTVAILSGGNIDASRLATLLTE